MTEWREYQERAADFFRNIGLDANTDETINGVRTTHDIDVVVRSDHVGFNLLWLVECKHWKTRVSKLHVLALREIVADVGADRGILLAESGYQRGAIEAAHLTNVQVTSLQEMSASAADALGLAKLRTIQDRADVCRERYWQIPKETRIDHGLRPSIFRPVSYSTTSVLEVTEMAINEAFRGKFPMSQETLARDVTKIAALSVPIEAASPNELYEVLDALISDLEDRLDRVQVDQERPPDGIQ